MEDEDRGNKKRGRPLGHKLSDKTKEKIRIKRLGTRHSQETKNKISKSLSRFFKGKKSFADCLAEEYIYISEDATKWIFENDEDIDDADLNNIITNKKINSLRQVEIALGMDVDQFFGHNANPEFLLLLKERIEEEGGEEILKEFLSLI